LIDFLVGYYSLHGLEWKAATPSGSAGQVRPRRSRSDRRGSPPAPRKASAWNGNQPY